MYDDIRIVACYTEERPPSFGVFGPATGNICCRRHVGLAISLKLRGGQTRHKDKSTIGNTYFLATENADNLNGQVFRLDYAAYNDLLRYNLSALRSTVTLKVVRLTCFLLTIARMGGAPGGL